MLSQNLWKEGEHGWNGDVHEQLEFVNLSMAETKILCDLVAKSAEGNLNGNAVCVMCPGGRRLQPICQGAPTMRSKITGIRT